MRGWGGGGQVMYTWGNLGISLKLTDEKDFYNTVQYRLGIKASIIYWSFSLYTFKASAAMPQERHGIEEKKKFRKVTHLKQMIAYVKKNKTLKWPWRDRKATFATFRLLSAHAVLLFRDGGRRADATYGYICSSHSCETGLGYLDGTDTGIIRKTWENSEGCGWMGAAAVSAFAAGCRGDGG